MSILGTKLLLNMLLEGYINVKKQGDRTFHITCIGGQQSSDKNSSQNLDPESVSLSTDMFQTKQPQVNHRYINLLRDTTHSPYFLFSSFFLYPSCTITPMKHQEADRLFDAINSFVAQDRLETSVVATANV